VNAPIACRRLAPLGVLVVRCHSPRLPFADAAFDLIINRHEELEPAEVARVLRPGGRVITQQVGGENWDELRAYFPRRSDFRGLRERYAQGFAAAGLTITANERHDQKVAYPSLGELVYLLTIAPWEIPNFELERDLDALLALEAACTTADGLVLTSSRFLIVAEKA
jgi:SAM-dependent methyltransferase